MCLEGEEDVDEQSKKDPSKYPSDCGSFLFSFHQYSVWENSMFFVSMYHLYVVLDLGGIRRRLSSSTFYSSYHITLQWKEQDKVTDWQWRVLDWRKVQGRTGQGDLKDLKEQIWRNRASWQTWRNRARWWQTWYFTHTVSWTWRTNLITFSWAEMVVPCVLN